MLIQASSFSHFLVKELHASNPPNQAVITLCKWTRVNGKLPEVSVDQNRETIVPRGLGFSGPAQPSPAQRSRAEPAQTRVGNGGTSSTKVVVEVLLYKSHSLEKRSSEVSLAHSTMGSAAMEEAKKSRSAVFRSFVLWRTQPCWQSGSTFRIRYSVLP